MFGKDARPAPAPHGTYGRYLKEINAYQGESCAACKAAARDYQRSRKRRTNKCAKGLGWPLGDPR